ncbi:MAG: hypothetical protein AAF703_21745 [Cyanobacteria bacterium P01_D01_bin.105]
MTTSPLYSNELTLSPRAKVIPYASDRLIDSRDKSVKQSANYGFRNLKIKPSLIETIPELESDGSLKALVQEINKKETCFFTVGCSSVRVQTDEGHQHRGYLELAWNCTGCIQDAINYFALYFHFEQSLRKKSFNQPVQIKWVIQEASFSDVDINGFSCAVHIETRPLSSPEQAHQVWQLSLRMIQAYLETVITMKSTPIYKPLSECLPELPS